MINLDLSIVIVGHNHCLALRGTLDSLLNKEWEINYEVILVDNQSTDGTTHMVRNEFPKVFILNNDKQYGFAKNVNRGIYFANKGRYILLLNPDVNCLSCSLEALVGFMDNHLNVGVAGPKLLNPDNTIQPSCRRFTNPVVPIYRFFGINQSKVIQESLMNDWDHDKPLDVDFITGACMIVRREALAEVGLFDECFFLYCEDQDFCLRMWHQGWEVYYVPLAVMIHDLQRNSAKGFLNKYQRTHICSYLRLYRKHGYYLHRPNGRSLTESQKLMR